MLNVDIEDIANKLLVKMNLEKNNYHIAYNFVKNYVDSMENDSLKVDDVNLFVLNSCINLYKNTITKYNMELENNLFLSDKNISDIAIILSNNKHIPDNIFALKSLIRITIQLLLMEYDPHKYSYDEFNNIIIEKCKKLLCI